MRPATIESPKERKARGAFYTPSLVTDFLAAWAIRGPRDVVLEPSCGDGAFLGAASRRLAQLGLAQTSGALYGVESDPAEASKAQAMAPAATIRVGSFFDADPSAMPSMDAVIGNPPFIRYHDFRGADRERAKARAAAEGVALTGLASSWAPFIVHATAFLRAGGRLGMVVPAELLTTEYSQPIRTWLQQRFASVTIIAFDRMVFPEAQVDAVLLLASDDEPTGPRVIRVRDENELVKLDLTTASTAREPARGRWSDLVDGQVTQVYDELLSSDRFVRLGDIARVDIGIVTGANRFFVLTPEEATELGLPRELLSPIVERPGDVRGLRVLPTETKLLLDLADHPEPSDPAVLAHLQRGVETGVADGYKARSRRRWYAVPRPKLRADAFLPYMNHRAPRLVVADPGMLSTNLLHGVARRSGAPDVRALAGSMLGAATLLSAEVEGRPYGGGVLKLETKEAERLIVPLLSRRSERWLIDRYAHFDALARDGRMTDVSRMVDDHLRVGVAGLGDARATLLGRRLGRRSAGPPMPEGPSRLLAP